MQWTEYRCECGATQLAAENQKAFCFRHRKPKPMKPGLLGETQAHYRNVLVGRKELVH